MLFLVSGWPLGGELTDTRLELGAQWYAVGLSTNEPERFQGFHSERLLLVLDEANGVDERIYEAGPLRLLEVISESEKGRSAVLVIGHNPGMEELLQILTGRNEQMATGTLSKIDLNADEWNKVREGASLDWIVKPKELAAG